MASKDETIARAIRDHAVAHPDDTVDDIVEALAAEHGVDHARVVWFIDEWRVKDTGGVEHVGPGGGGGWRAA
jgi:hypothetical protein